MLEDKQITIRLPKVVSIAAYLNAMQHIANVRQRFMAYGDLYEDAMDKNCIKSWATMVRAYLDYLESGHE